MARIFPVPVVNTIFYGRPDGIGEVVRKEWSRVIGGEVAQPEEVTHMTPPLVIPGKGGQKGWRDLSGRDQPRTQMRGRMGPSAGATATS